MKFIEVNISNCVNPLDVMDRIVVAIGAPMYHGRSIDSFIDSMIWGEMNSINPPFIILWIGYEDSNKEVREFIEKFEEYISEALVEENLKRNQTKEIAFRKQN